jgi:PHD/YefM family antitoxin component YafN of YafNO toxin-antitoxin module
MKTMLLADAVQNLTAVINNINKSHETICLVGGENKNAVLISEEDWLSMQETLHLISIPNMKESIIAGLKEKTENCSNKLDW